jgi:ubiquitin carboxyl-terminal hydrolase 16
VKSTQSTVLEEFRTPRAGFQTSSCYGCSCDDTATNPDTIANRLRRLTMPEKPLTIATYAAGASLAAITLVYVFAPTFFIDGDPGGSSANCRRRGVVGLLNTANDCFINSVCQALAGLGDLRIYLIRETHRRNLDGESVYSNLVEDPARRRMPAWKLEGLQQGIVTQGLKDMLDALNERPLYRKTISPTPFIRILEEAFRQRISRQQQDAQEFLQVVAERLCDEYHAGQRARRAWIEAQILEREKSVIDGEALDHQLSRLAVENGIDSTNYEKLERPHPSVASPIGQPHESQDPERNMEEEEGFPFEGQSESQIECLTCGFKPKPSSSSFCTLTLNVPKANATTLNACFDGMFKTEYIDDFKCEKCRLIHAVEAFEAEIANSTAEESRVQTLRDMERLKLSIETDPERPPEDIKLPDTKFAPKRKIARHIRITRFPKIIAIHLSRSIFDIGRSSMKNPAKVEFPVTLPLGGLLDRKRYKLLGVVTHKGSHQSGHYESFRRQNIYPPFSTPNAFDKSGVYSRSNTPSASTLSTPQVRAVQQPDGMQSSSSTPELLSPASASPHTSSRVSLASSLSSSTYPQEPTDSLINGQNRPKYRPTSAPRESSKKADAETSSLRSVARSARTTLSKMPSGISHTLSRSSTRSSLLKPSYPAKGASREISKTLTGISVSSLKPRQKRASSDRWWRISDEKIKECKTSEVLGMQKEVYLLFYELEKEEVDDDD